MEKVENIKQVIEDEINNYNHGDDTYLIISVHKDIFRPDSVDKHYALITYFKYWLVKNGYNLFLMFVAEQNSFEKKKDTLQDI
jgi:hypothetical protein